MNIITLYLFFQTFFSTTLVQAAYSLKDADKNLIAVQGPTGIGDVDVYVVVAEVIRAGFLLVGILFFILMFYGGITLLLARGEEDKIKKATNTIVAAVIGLIISILSYTISTFVGGLLE